MKIQNSIYLLNNVQEFSDHIFLIIEKHSQSVEKIYRNYIFFEQAVEAQLKCGGRGVSPSCSTQLPHMAFRLRPFARRKRCYDRSR